MKTIVYAPNQSLFDAVIVEIVDLFEAVHASKKHGYIVVDNTEPQRVKQFLSDRSIRVEKLGITKVLDFEVKA